MENHAHNLSDEDKRGFEEKRKIEKDWQKQPTPPLSETVSGQDEINQK